MWKKLGKRAPGWTKALSVRHEYATSGPGRRRASAPARALQARAVRVAGYREADALANLAVRGLQLAQGELKSTDVEQAATNMSWSGDLILLNGIARGDDIDERIGRQITMKSIEVHMRFEAKAPEAGVTPSAIRVLIVYDRQTNGAALTVAQVLSSVGGPLVTLAPKNLENRDRFQILRDMKFGLPCSVSTDFMAAPKVMKFYQGVNLSTTYNTGDAGTVADITTGSLYMITLASDAAAGAHMPLYSFVSRVRYADN